MPRHSRWADLRLGLVALLSLMLGAAAVLRFARVGALRGPTLRVYAATAHARGVTAGSEVWLAGSKIGRVLDVGFRPPSTDSVARVLLTLEVLERARPLLRRDARVGIEAGGSFIGAPVIALTSGTPQAPPISDGDTLVALPDHDLDVVRAQVATASSEVPIIMANVRVLASQLKTAHGTLGALVGDGPPAGLARARQAAGTLTDRALNGNGTVALALGDGELSRRASRAMARASALRAAVGGREGTLGRLTSDSAFTREVLATRADLAEVARLLDQPVGTAGRLRGDAVLRQDVEAARAALDALIADLKRNPLRYINF